MKRIICCVLCVLLFLTCAAMPAQASAEEQLRQDIIESCQTGEKVGLFLYGILEETLDTVFWELYHSGKLPWYTDRTYTFTYNEDTGIVQFFIPALLDEQEYDRVLYEQRIAEVIHATVFEGMSQWQMALSVHDYLIAHCVYDESLTLHSGYDLLVKGSTVCSGYSQLYMDIMNRLGIPCVTVESDGMNHAWNLVNIDGQWYHADLTWDDPSPDTRGMVNHTYFLLTDEEIAVAGEEPHYGWETDITCTDAAFQDAFWKDITSQICYADSNTSYLRRDEDWDSYICSRDEMTGEQTVLYTDELEYINIGVGEYGYPHHGLSLWNGRLYFSSTDTLYSMNLDGSDVVTEYSLDPYDRGQFIYGSFVDNGSFCFSMSDHDFNCTPLEIASETADYHTHSYTQTVTAPGCLEGGYTTYACSCGITLELEPTSAVGHSYENTVELEPTLFDEGVLLCTCTGCGDTYREVLSPVPFIRWLIDQLHSLFG